MLVTIYTDGGADPNPGVGGWAAILSAGKHEKVLTGNEKETTNNRMELQAAISALSALKRPSQVEFHTDSEYLKKGITEWIEEWSKKGWKRKGKDIANKDLWQELLPLVERHEINWHWVRGHSGNVLNERVDRLARQSREAISPGASLPEGGVRLLVRATCKGNPGPGGWGAIIEQDDDTRQYSGSMPRTTNNRMEMLAIIEGLQFVDSNLPVQIVTSSDYVFQGATRWIHGWRKRDWKKKDGKRISNHDLWLEIDNYLNTRDLKWIRAKGKVKDSEPGLIEAAQLASLAVVEFE
jgi:ribonuclease HI